MSSSPQSPRVVRGGFALLDLSPRRIVRAMVFQYNPEALRRTLVPAPDGDGAAELVQLELAFDALDRSSVGDPQAALGIQPQLATLESIAFPPRALAKAPLTILVWGRARVLPVRVTELEAIEEAFDQVLHPIRATVAVTMEVLGPRHGAPVSEHPIVRRAHAERARLARKGAAGLAELGIDESRLLG